MSENLKGRPDSVQVSLSSLDDVPGAVSRIQSVLQAHDSVQVSLKGSVSAIVTLLQRVGPQIEKVSAAFSARGDKPSKA